MNLSKLALITISLYGSCLIFQSCQSSKESESLPVSSPLSHVKDEKVKALLTKVFDKSGGLVAWKQVNSLKFKKYFALYDSTGTIEKEVHQVHDYAYLPTQNINISWEKEGANHLLNYTNNQITKTINGEADTTAKPSSLLNSVLSATFVMGIPFNLLDEGIEFKYLGKEALEEGQKVEVLQAAFNPDQHNNHSTKDTWTYYFGQESHQLVAYMVQHADHFSYVKNLTTETVKGFVFPKMRKSWRVTKDRKILYLRAVYEYTDVEVK